MNDDGTVARMGDITRFKDRFGLRMISIADLVRYRAKSCCALQAPGSPLDVP
jgi:3,4-dihydroxy 2-butanone 4-phosphate synthase/GTP cyclohydrolase II